MSYKVVYSKTALKEIKSLPGQYARKVIEKSEQLADNSRPAGCKKLVGNKEEMWRIRVGGHRKDIYE